MYHLEKSTVAEHSNESALDKFQDTKTLATPSDYMNRMKQQKYSYTQKMIRGKNASN